MKTLTFITLGLLFAAKASAQIEHQELTCTEEAFSLTANFSAPWKFSTVHIGQQVTANVAMTNKNIALSDFDYNMLRLKMQNEKSKSAPTTSGSSNPVNDELFPLQDSTRAGNKTKSIFHENSVLADMNIQAANKASTKH